MTPEQIDLLPCPFCGGEAKIRTSFFRGANVECTQCGASTGWLGQIADCPTPPAIRRRDAWNRRASPVNTALAEDAARAHDLALEVERLKRANDNLHKVNADYRNRLNGQFHAATAAVLSARDSIPEGE